MNRRKAAKPGGRAGSESRAAPRGAAARGVRRPGPGTRERLIAVALDRFARHGFEAVGTRAIAEAAGVNLAAIRYHFGGKEGLYTAVAAHIVDEIWRAIGPLVDGARERAATPGPEEARAALHGFLAGYMHLLVTNPATESWARFIVREQMTPSPAFDILYDGVIGPTHAFLTELAAALTGAPPESSEAKLTAFTLMGQTLVFRVARAAVLKRMGWSGIGEAEMGDINAVIAAMVDGLLAHGASQREGK